MFSFVKYPPPPIVPHPTPEHFDEFKSTLSKVALTKVTVFLDKLFLDKYL